MSKILFASVATLALALTGAAYVAFPKADPAPESCCYPGAECCYPGSPCCGESAAPCCDEGAPCCNPPQACCAAAK